MIVTGLTKRELLDSLTTVTDAFNGNVYPDGGHYSFGSGIDSKSETRHRLRLRTFDSTSTGTRHSASGRKGPYACWHVTEAFCKAVFSINPNARIYTAFAKYRGIDEFNAEYPETYWHEAGSMINPVYFGELCNDC